MKNTSLLTILFLFLFTYLLFPQNDLERELKALNSIIKVERIEPYGAYTQSFKIFIEQPVDHKNPDGEKFKQKFYLSHIDKELPMVIELDGYNIDTNRPNELAEILQCNKIVVEHRYFGESVPETFDWNNLTIEQAANDHHKIIKTLKNIYKGQWITTGISKGGQTTIFHKYFYPDDADASVAYVAPLNLAEEDPRVYNFLDNVGTEECREKMVLFQREVLKRADELIPLFKEQSKNLGYTYSIGNDRFIFEYLVLEYGFAFWQWQNTTCEEIPDNSASDKELFVHLVNGSSLDYFSDQDVSTILPFFYQAYAEIGYYGYDISEVKDLLREVKEPTSRIFLTESLNPVFNCSAMHNVNNWIQKNGNNMIFIYGEYDSWSSTAVELTGETNALKMVKEKGTHTTRILSFDKEDQNRIKDSLEVWLDYKIPDLE
jgi:hypothetical protein